MESTSLKQPKISLEDYAYKQDLENRLLLSQFTPQDLLVLEEILYSSLQIPVAKLATSVDLTQDELLPILVKLSKTGLFAFDKEDIIVDKELRKYFEVQIQRFDPDFRPGMEFLQSQLRSVPIHVQPLWYSISRTSNHIFDSIVEKYLLTPQILARYLEELNFPELALMKCVKEVYKAPHFRVPAESFAREFKLSNQELQECILKLELHFVCCLHYEKKGEGFEAVLTPFQEWLDYVNFLDRTQTPSILPGQDIERRRPHDFSYIQDLSQVLLTAKKQPFAMSTSKGRLELPPDSLSLLSKKLEDFSDTEFKKTYIQALIDKLSHLKLASVVDNRLYALESANDFLDLSTENKALFLYRHPLNRSSFHSIPAEILTDRVLREAEKSIIRVLDKGWVYLEDFLPGVLVSLGEQSTIALKRQGKSWKYTLPVYSEDELALIRVIVLEWLFELGITAVGKQNGKDCFCVTSFGKSLFGA